MVNLQNKNEIHGVSCIYCKQAFGIEITVPEPEPARIYTSFGQFTNTEAICETSHVSATCPHCHGTAEYKYNYWSMRTHEPEK